MSDSFVTASEFTEPYLTRLEQNLPLVSIEPAWGNWFLDHSTPALVHKPTDYWVDLRECRTPVQIVKWQAHISAKTWATSEDVGNFFRLLNAIFDLEGATE